MSPEFLTSAFNIYLWVMIALAVVVFVTLYFVKAGYGVFVSDKWGKTINNKVAWFLMEFPIFLAMIVIWLLSPHRFDIVPLVFLLVFEVHYFQRSIIFPWLMKGKASKMSLIVMFCGIAFNILNAVMQGYWIFFYVNLRSDYIIRHLRKSDEDTNHYLPEGFMFEYVTSANYLGELTEWLGFAILTWSLPGLVFFIWTFANLVPRADALYKRYKVDFGEIIERKKLKRVFPFVY